MIRGTWVKGWALVALLVLVPAARAGESDEVQQAIDRGVAYLKSLQGPDGKWPYGQQLGATSLAGLVLLECEVPADDPAVQKAAAAVREESIRITDTYSLALTLLFLDRLGDAGDVPLIQSMAVRLLGGQQADGGWTYLCPPLVDEEVRRLTTQFRQRNELVAKTEVPPANIKGGHKPAALPKEIQEQIKLINKVGPGRGGSDNSNTQFGILALWVARRHGIPIEVTAARVQARFRNSQNKDGGWGYTPMFHNSALMIDTSSPSMTCAGLIGMAIVYGTANTPMNADDKTKPSHNPAKDPCIRAGLLALGTTIGQPVGRRNGRRVPLPVIAQGAVNYYFMWSLERVGVIYGLKTIGKKDWYAWGSELLVASQGQDGSWQGQYGQGGIDTDFALLFLRRANLVQDLSVSLRGQVRDPAEVTLTAGGVGGESLEVQGPEPAFKPDVNPDPPTDKGSPAPVAKSEPAQRPAGGQDLKVDPEAARLTTDLVKASPDRQGELIDKFKDSKGIEYTEALAGAIHHLEGEAKGKAREALAQRMTRMTADTLRSRLQDEDPEIRSAAALACAMKEDQGHVPDLVRLLVDPEARVGLAAHVALKTLTGKDFGPVAGATPVERSAAVAAWKSWWELQSQK